MVVGGDGQIIESVISAKVELLSIVHLHSNPLL